MSAYNWIEFEGCCPSCQKKAVIRCQIHTCSDYDGDDTGRFHDRIYKLGDVMAWWPVSDPRYNDWLDSNTKKEYEYDANTECCYAECGKCSAELFSVIKFNNCSPAEVLGLGLEKDWPKDYLK